MRIDGEWLRGRYDEVRPVFRGRVAAANGTIVDALFLVDTGADKPVLSADVFAALGLPRILISRLSVVGVGGAVTTVPVDAKLHLFRDTGGPVALNGPFLAFTDPDALDISVLGRDLLNHFALIVDWPSQTICLLNQNHRYAITSV